STLKSPSYTKSVSWQHYRSIRHNDIKHCLIFIILIEIKTLTHPARLTMN
ncbi:pili assembly protein, partial [Shigella flexneri]